MTIIKTEFALALNQVATERGISPDEVIASIEAAVVAAYKKEYPEKTEANINAKINKDTGETRILEDDKDITPPGFGRIAAQTAKQVILQKIREAEKKTVAIHYRSQIGTTIKGRVIRYDGYNAYFDIGKAEAILPKEEQIKNESYQVNDSLIIYLKEITDDKFGNPRIIVSRADPKLIEELFKREVPEIANGTVEIKKVAREPGERAKIAVASSQSGVDPVGACVGQKGVRVQTVTDELGGLEKIDIIQWNKDEKLFLIAALSPAKISSVEIDKEGRKAKVMVEEKEAPLAIGRGGINVNLASRLTEFEIDIIQTKSKESTTTPKVTSENKVSEEKPKAQVKIQKAKVKNTSQN
jgi:N utilization substance protein A